MNYSTTIESSATYQILISMGFSSDICKSASKIYLNDIEDAVTYCSSLSTQCSMENNDNQGINFKKCYDLLQTSYPQLLSLFIDWFKEEEFEDDQLNEEFVENNDCSESFFIQYIKDNAENILFNDSIATQLFSDLSDAITNQMYDSCNIASEVFKTILIDGYIREISNILNKEQQTTIPRTLYVVCHAYYPKFNNNIINIYMNSSNNKHLINKIKSLYQLECSKLYDQSCPNELFSLLAIGQQNNIPLLTYLIDSYNRYNMQRYARFISRIQTYKDSYKRYNTQRFKSLLSLNEMSIEQFVADKCKIFADHPSFQDMCIKSMEYLASTSKLSKLSLSVECQSIYRINDSLINLTNYICQTYKFIHKYINNLSYSSMPCQFDLIIVPKNVRDIDTNKKMSSDWNIQKMLLTAHIPFVELKTFGAFPDLNEMQKLVQKVIKNNKNQRCCILIDRRDVFDKIYIYQMEDKINANRQLFINESLFNNSINLFSLSFHIISKYEVRVYLNINGFITRFFITDIKTYLPKFFKTNDLTHNNKFKQIYNTVNQIKSVQSILSDSKFDEFYKLILMNDAESPYYFLL